MLKQEPHNGGFIGLPTARPGLYGEVSLLKEETIGIIFEMTRPLPTKIGSIEGGMGHARSSVRYFVFFRNTWKVLLEWALPSRAAQ